MSTGAGYANLNTFTFGDNEKLCNRLLDLVRSGKKTATCSALRDFDPNWEPMPAVGRRDIALHWDGSPALIIETVEVFQKRLCDIDESFALAEGENEDLAGWRRDHEAYVRRNGGFDPEMVLVCERFRLICEYRAGASETPLPPTGP